MYPLYLCIIYYYFCFIYFCDFISWIVYVIYYIGHLVIYLFRISHDFFHAFVHFWNISFFHFVPYVFDISDLIFFFLIPLFLLFYFIFLCLILMWFLFFLYDWVMLKIFNLFSIDSFKKRLVVIKNCFFLPLRFAPLFQLCLDIYIAIPKFNCVVFLLRRETWKITSFLIGRFQYDFWCARFSCCYGLLHTPLHRLQIILFSSQNEVFVLLI